MSTSKCKVYLIVLISFVTISYQYEIVQISPQRLYIPRGANVNDYYSLVSNYLNYNEKVEIKLYYETLCPDCIDFDTNQFKKVIEELSDYLNIYTYPYGNARTFINNSVIIFQCQHGERECYGNKLHACALDTIQNKTAALLYNSCMMTRTGQGSGSDDAAADRCGMIMNVNSNVIKACAKGPRGTQLLKYYGDESSKANYNYVPYVLINGQVNDGDNFLRDVCRAFAVSPPPCRKYGL